MFGVNAPWLSVVSAARLCDVRVYCAVRRGANQSDLRAGQVVAHHRTCLVHRRRDGALRWTAGSPMSLLPVASIYTCRPLISIDVSPALRSSEGLRSNVSSVVTARHHQHRVDATCRKQHVERFLQVERCIGVKIFVAKEAYIYLICLLYTSDAADE